eukprot:TRINITY_DN17012_c0_g1_i1.p1 TRINITY_DN17012_c0_g1~~TRINITY_DN17012_c0_g1_i1.p1  ORF type:complete len:227 (-),score=59.30 TRINITY_DN17012_c0_g1_i1:90-770(-)
MTTDRSAEQEAPGRAAQAQADEAEDADEDEEIEDLDAEVQDGESMLSPSGRRRRRRRRNRRSTVLLQAAASGADFIQPSAPESLAADASDDEAGRPRNVVTWNDLLGNDHNLKPDSPSGGFQCAKAACWDRLVQEQLPHQSQQQQQLYQEKLQQPWGQHQDYQQLLGQNCSDTPYWVVTESPPDWTPAHSAHLQNWLCTDMMQGSVPQLSELDVVLQSLASEVYED